DSERTFKRIRILGSVPPFQNPQFAIRNPKFLAPRSRQHLNPTVHALLGAIEFRLREELQRIDFVDWIDGAMKVLLVTVRHGRIDSHAAFEPSVRRGPFLLARGHSFLRLKSLTNASWRRIDNIGMRFNARRQ